MNNPSTTDTRFPPGYPPYQPASPAKAPALGTLLDAQRVKSKLVMPGVESFNESTKLPFHPQKTRKAFKDGRKAGYSRALDRRGNGQGMALWVSGQGRLIQDFVAG